MITLCYTGISSSVFFVFVKLSFSFITASRCYQISRSWSGGSRGQTCRHDGQTERSPGTSWGSGELSRDWVKDKIVWFVAYLSLSVLIANVHDSSMKKKKLWNVALFFFLFLFFRMRDTIDKGKSWRIRFKLWKMNLKQRRIDCSPCGLKLKNG